MGGYGYGGYGNGYGYGGYGNGGYGNGYGYGAYGNGYGLFGLGLGGYGGMILLRKWIWREQLLFEWLQFGSGRQPGFLGPVLDYQTYEPVDGIVTRSITTRPGWTASMTPRLRSSSRFPRPRT